MASKRRLRRVGKIAGAKSQAQRIHAKRRALHRFGLELNTGDLKAIVEKIQNNKAKFVSRDSLRISKFQVEVDGKQVVCVYDKQRKEIVTFLTLGMVQNEKA